MSKENIKVDIFYEELRSAEFDLNNAYETISELAARINDLEAIVESKGVEAEEARAKLQAQVSKNNYLRSVITSMQQSSSWKLTRPLRKISQLVKSIFS